MPTLEDATSEMNDQNLPSWVSYLRLVGRPPASLAKSTRTASTATALSSQQHQSRVQSTPEGEVPQQQLLPFNLSSTDIPQGTTQHLRNNH